METVSDKQHYSFQTIGIEQMKAHYLFSEEDATTLHNLLPVAHKALPQMEEAFYRFIFNFEHAKVFLNTDDVISKHQKGIEQWYLNLFSGQYDTRYFEGLSTISETHVKVGLPAHYVNAAFSFVRQFLENVLIASGHTDKLSSLHKIIDINLDILSLTYKQESQQKLIKSVAILKDTVKRNGIVPYVQAIYSNRTGEISHYECLMRITDTENRTVCSIIHMLQLAKQIHLYHDLMRQMIEKTFETFRYLPYAFTLNLSYEDIANIDSRNFLKEELAQLPNPSRVTFEILETDMIGDYDIVYDFIAEVKQFQCQIAIDDFGSGYSNMENLLKLKPDYLKIDGSLIQNVDRSEKSLKLVKNIINIARDINARTIAEHVHSKAVYDILHALDIDCMQGFYLCEPFPLSELA